MRVKYSQTPPPVVDEEAEGVRVTKQLTQVADYQSGQKHIKNRLEHQALFEENFEFEL